MTHDNPKQESPGRYRPDKPTEGEAGKTEQQSPPAAGITPDDTQASQQKWLEDTLKQFAGQLAEAIKTNNLRPIGQDAKNAVEKYREIAAALFVSREAVIVSPAPEQPGSEAPVSKADKPKQQNQASQAGS